MGTTASPASAASIRAELEKVLGSPVFKTPESQAGLLRSMVEETLAGRGGALGESTVEAIRLRALLREYYDGEGSNDPIRIHLPENSCVPVFLPQERGSSQEHTIPGRWIVLGIVIFAATVIVIAMTWARKNIRTAPLSPPSIILTVRRS